MVERTHPRLEVGLQEEFSRRRRRRKGLMEVTVI